MKTQKSSNDGKYCNKSYYLKIRIKDRINRNLCFYSKEIKNYHLHKCMCTIQNERSDERSTIKVSSSKLFFQTMLFYSYIM